MKCHVYEMENSKWLKMIILLKLIQTKFLQELKTSKNVMKIKNLTIWGKRTKLENLHYLISRHYEAIAIETLRCISVPTDTQKHETELTA